MYSVEVQGMERELLNEAFMEGFREEVNHRLSMKNSTDETRNKKTVWVGKIQ